MDDIDSLQPVRIPRHPAGYYLVIAVFFSLLIASNSYLAWNHQQTLGVSTQSSVAQNQPSPTLSPTTTPVATYPLCFRKDPTPTIPLLRLSVEPTLAELAARCPVLLLKKYAKLPIATISLYPDRFVIAQPGLTHTVYEHKPEYTFVSDPQTKALTKTLETAQSVDATLDGRPTKGVVLSKTTCTARKDTTCKEAEKALLLPLVGDIWIQIDGDYISTVLTKNFAVDFPIEITAYHK